MREVYISSRFRTPKSATCLPVYFDKCAIRQYILFRTSRSSLFLDDQRTEVSGNVIFILGKAKQWIPVHSAKTKREGAREIGSLQDGLRDVDTGSRKIGRGGVYPPPFTRCTLHSPFSSKSQETGRNEKRGSSCIEQTHPHTHKSYTYIHMRPSCHLRFDCRRGLSVFGHLAIRAELYRLYVRANCSVQIRASTRRRQRRRHNALRHLPTHPRHRCHQTFPPVLFIKYPSPR
jgi:hypothetical protein